MKAEIMPGGFGAHLRPFTAHLPDPLVLIPNLSILEHTGRLPRRDGWLVEEGRGYRGVRKEPA
jgi:hypothetical protein